MLTPPKTPLIASLFACSLLSLSCGDDNPVGGNGIGVGNGPGGNIDGGTVNGSDSGSGNGSDSDICSTTTVGTGRGSPEMLIVLDRSGSMRTGGVDRWGPSVSGIKKITDSLQDSVSFGLMAFPGTGSGAPAVDCNAITDVLQRIQCVIMNSTGGGGGAQGGDTCQAGSLNVPIAANNAAVIAAALDAMRPNGATPTAVTLEAAHAVLGSNAGGGLDAPPRNPYVLLVTDGAPNCTGGGFGNGGQDQQAVNASVAAIEAMAMDGIKTYVLGYGTQNDSELKTALDRMAVAGNTGDTMHRPVEDEQSLVRTFDAISGSVLSCDFKLDTAVPNKDYVLVTLDQKKLGVDHVDGWILSADRRTVTLQGSACTTVKEAGHQLNVTVQCDRVPPLM